MRGHINMGDRCKLCGDKVMVRTKLGVKSYLNKVCLVCYMRIPKYISYAQYNEYIELKVKKNEMSKM